MKKWTEEELERLRKNFSVATKKDLLQLFPDRTYQSLIQRAGTGKWGLCLKKDRSRFINMVHLKMTETEIAYLAGMIDADGTITLLKNSKATTLKPKLQVSNTDTRIMDWLMLKIPEGIVNKRKKQPRHKIAYLWRLEGLRILEILKRLQPHLIIKINRCGTLISFVERRLEKKIGDKYLKEDYECYEKIKILNLRGSKD